MSENTWAMSFTYRWTPAQSKCDLKGALASTPPGSDIPQGSRINHSVLTHISLQKVIPLPCFQRMLELQSLLLKLLFLYLGSLILKPCSFIFSCLNFMPHMFTHDVNDTRIPAWCSYSTKTTLSDYMLLVDIFVTITEQVRNNEMRIVSLVTPILKDNSIQIEHRAILLDNIIALSELI